VRHDDINIMLLSIRCRGNLFQSQSRRRYMLVFQERVNRRTSCLVKTVQFIIISRVNYQITSRQTRARYQLAVSARYLLGVFF